MALRISVAGGLFLAGSAVIALFPQNPVLGVPFAIALLSYLASQRAAPRDAAVLEPQRGFRRLGVVAFTLLVLLGVAMVGLLQIPNLKGETDEVAVAPAGLARQRGNASPNMAFDAAAVMCDEIRTQDMWWMPSDDDLSRSALNNSARLAVLLRTPWSQDDLGLALRDAAGADNASSARLLLTAGADPDVQPLRPPSGDIPAHRVESPILVAVRMGSIQVLQLMLESGADPNLVIGWPLLVQAISARSNRPETIEMLLQHGAVADLTDGLGRTALHRAATYGCADAIEVLLSHGANPALLDNYGQTAAVRARAAGFAGLAQRIDSGP